MASGWFVDLHSHVVPSGDDGAQSMDEGAELCRAAARHGTRTLFATPHVGAHAERDELGWQRVRDGLASVVASDGHRATRPARLDDAWELVHAELGAAARPLFDGSALGLEQPLEQPHRVLRAR